MNEKQKEPEIKFPSDMFDRDPSPVKKLDRIPEELLEKPTFPKKFLTNESIKVPLDQSPEKIIEGLESAKKSIGEAINALGKEKQGKEM